MPSSVVPSSNNMNNLKDGKNNFPAVFDSYFLGKQTKVPADFIWPEEDQPLPDPLEELTAPLVNLEGFLRGDEAATRAAAELLARAGQTHGFFQVINHGVDAGLIRRGLELAEAFFKLPVEDKLRAKKPRGSRWGYSAAHGERFSAKLPWKETISFGYYGGGGASSTVVSDYFVAVLGKDFEEYGIVYQKYCAAVFELCLNLCELLAISLGVDRMHYREFFHDADSIMRCNYYPICPEPNLTLGTGPHCDPTSITVLQQDNTGGLEVLHDGDWYSISPVPGALVINVGDTFKALTNGKYKSCLHRALVNKDKGRLSMAFFLCPKGDKVVRPPNELLAVPLGGDGDGHHGDGDGERAGTRKYPDFTWADMIRFLGTSNYRADPDTLQNFINWFQQSSNNEQLIKST